MLMAGGAIFGYCEIVSFRMDKAPANIKTIAITQANTGLSIKNFAMFYPLIRGRRVIGGRRGRGVSRMLT